MTDANLAAVNARVVELDDLTEELGGVTTREDVQDAVELVYVAAAALGAIADYAEDDTSNSAPTAATYTTAGVTGVTDANLAAVNARVAAADREGADTVAEVDALVQQANGDVDAAAAAATALGTIVAYADDQSNTEPTVDTYTTAGVTGVTDVNLAAVNARVAGADREGADTVSELDALVGLANEDIAAAAAATAALGTIAAYAEDDQSNPAPDAATYTTAGVTGVTADNLAAVNARVAGADREGADTVAELDALVTLANEDVAAAAAALGTIASYAEDDANNPAPTVDTYATAGVTGVTDANLAAVNAAIATGGSSAFVPDTLVEPTVFVQGVVNRVISSSETGDGENQTSPTDTTSTETPDGTGDGDVGGNADAAVAAATALGTIADYADDDANNPAPTAATYTTAGVTGVTAANLAAVNARVAAADREGADTVAEVDALVQQANGDVDAAAAAATALGTIVAYADDQSNTEPTVDTYTTAGVTGVTDANLAAVNARVAAADREGADTVAEVDALVQQANGDVDAAAAAATALGTIVAYADDQSNTEPTVDTYTTAGVTGVTDVNLAAVNARVAGADREGADTVSELDALVGLANGDVDAAAAAATALGTIVAYADDQSNPAPDAATYTTAGVTGVTADNLAAVNARVAGADREGADTVAELDALVTLANEDVAAAAAALGTIASYAEDDANNPAPTVDTYATAGVTGVTAANLAAVNARVAGLAREGADTVSELDALVTLANGDVAAAAAAATALGTIADYAEDDQGNPAPTAATYATAGVTGVTDANLAAVNARVAGVAREGADTVSELDALVTLANGDVAAAAAALGTIASYAEDDANNPAPTVDTYATAGVTGVTDANLAAVNAAIATGGSSAFVPDTLVEPTVFVQGVVNRVISSSETGDGENQTSPTDTTSTETPDGTGDGDVGGNADAAVAAATALGTIADYADDDANNPAPDAATYTTAGVTGVTDANLAAVNARVAGAEREGADTVAELDALVGLANGDVAAAAAATAALGTIVAYADDQSNPAPDAATYTTAGVTGVTDANLAAVNARVVELDDLTEELGGVTTREDVQDAVELVYVAAAALGAIADYAEDDTSNSAPTAATYTTAGVTGVTDANLAAVNARVAAADREGADTVAEVDALVQQANGDVDAAAAAATALGTIVAYADDQSNTEPTVDTYTTAGVTGVTDVNLAAVNARVAGADREGADTVSELDALVGLANEDIAAAAAATAALGTIAAYAEDDQSNPAPDAATYTTAGVTGVTADNLAAVNARVAGADREGADTVAELDALVTLANEDVAAAAAALGTIASYAEDDANNPAPTVDTYATAGVTGVTDANLAAVNAAIATGGSSAFVPDTLVEPTVFVQGVVNRVISSSETGDGENQTSPTDTTSTETPDGTGDGDVGGNADAAVAAATALGTIADYADDDANNPAPTAATYTTAGVTGVTDVNLAAVNARVAGAEREGADTVAELDALVGLANGDVAAAAAATAALGTIVAYADDQSNPAPDAATYTTAGVTGVTDANLAAVNARVVELDDLTEELGGVTTREDVQDAVELVYVAAAALGAIADYAEDDTSNSAPTAATYTTAGVTGVTDANLAAVNARVAAADREGADTVAEVDALVQQANGDVDAAAAAATALGTIVAYADDQSNTEPTVDTYTTAGVTGVTDVNLAAVNARVAGADREGADTVSELDALVGLANEDIAAAAAATAALGTIAAYAEDDQSNPAPDAATYTTAGVTGVTADNLAAVNARVAGAEREGADTVAELDALVTLANEDVAAATAALGTIVAYADDQSNPAPDAATYTTAGVTGVTDANLAAVNARVVELDDLTEELGGVTTREDVQDAVELVYVAAAALGAIADYAEDDTSNSAPTAATYTTAGVTGVTDANLAAVNARVAAADREGADTVAEVDALVQQANGDVAAAAAAATALGTIVAYADDQSNTEPTVDTYTTAGVTGVTDVNLAAVNARVAGADREGADTVAELDALVTLANEDIAAAAAATAALGTIAAYAEDDQSNPAPDAATYTTAGVTGVTADNLAAVNARVAGADREGADTVAELDALVTLANEDVAAAAAALGTIASYAEDDANNPAPTVDTYATAGVTGVTDANLAAVNAAIATGGSSAFVPDTLVEPTVFVQGVVNRVISSSETGDGENQTSPTDTTSTETPDGTGDGDVGGNADAAVAAATALGTIADYADDDANNPAPTAATYTTAGVTGVTDANLAAVNARVAGAEREGADTVAELDALVGLANGDVAAAAAATAALGTIVAYADDQSNPAPDAATYTTAGVTGVTDANLAAVNARVVELDDLTEELGGVTTREDVQDAVELVYVAAAALGAIADYAEDDTSNSAPTAATYTTAGVTGVTDANLAAVNARVAAADREGADTVAEVDALVQQANGDVDAAAAAATALGTIVAYADDQSNTEPTVVSLTRDMSGVCNMRSVRFYSVSERRRYEPSRSVTGSSTDEV